VTNLFVGASGITSLSPVISVAQRTGELVFTAFDSSSYKLFAIKDSAVLAGKPVAPLPGPGADMLPLTTRQPDSLQAKLADSRTGLPVMSDTRVTPYSPGLSLDYVSQPYLAVGSSTFGTYVAGGATLVWSDMLSDHTLITGLQMNGKFPQDVGAVVAYQNQRRRLNWGLAAQQIPYIYGQFFAGFANQGTVYYEQSLLVRQTERSAVGFASYPLSRVQRLEFSAGYENISFSTEVQTLFFDGATFQFLGKTDSSAPSHSALNMGVASAALVYDNSFFGATSPILGSRYRLEADPWIGSLKVVSVTADYRKYIMPVRRLTLAARVAHAGRYGPDAESPVMYPLFLGYQQLVRGYDLYSFSAAECPSTGTTCPAFDRLFGSRLLLGNVEARFPLFGVLGLGSGYYGALPIEAGVFADAGVAWNSEQASSLAHRQAVTSAGAVLRMNLFGFAVAELDYVKPFQRPIKGWYWELSLTPGF
jgi:hypothetical protein